MTETRSGHLNKHRLLALRGLRLPFTALKGMRGAGIYCEPAISIERHSGQFVLRGVESGGAAGALGAYCSFVRPDGSALSYLQKVDSLSPNGVHATVVAPELMRVQIFRHQYTCALLITHHWLETIPGAKRPKLNNNILFHGRYGTIPEGSDANEVTSGVAPEFCTRVGDPRPLPQRFVWAIEQVTAAASCIGCKHCHVLMRATDNVGRNDEHV